MSGADAPEPLWLENEWLRVSIYPAIGAKIHSLVWKPKGREILWHNRSVAPRRFPVDGFFDDYWCGGWDDCFPTCDESVYRGQRYPSLGELRSIEWAVEDCGALSARLSAYGPISPVHATKTFTLDAAAAVVRVRHKITNIGERPVDFLWGTHPALNVSPGSVLRIPAREGVVGEASCLELGTAGQRYSWPVLAMNGAEVDMSRVQGPETGQFCGHFAVGLQGGWYAVEDPRSGTGFALKFPRETCRVLWLWLNYGGYRGHHHVIVEPWTGMPVTLNEAVSQGAHYTLEAGACFEVEIAATVYGTPENWKDALKRLNCEETE